MNEAGRRFDAVKSILMGNFSNYAQIKKRITQNDGQSLSPKFRVNADRLF